MNRTWLFRGLGLVLLAVLGRVLPHAANVTPLYAVALFACAYFPRRWALAVPVAAMVASDLIIGLHSTVAFTWSGMFVFALLGLLLRDRRFGPGVVVAAGAGSVAFFAWTNFGVWLTSGMYPHTVAGLVTCYTLALPFLRNSLLGDVAFSGALFAAYEWYQLRRRSRVPVAAAVR
jgi:hypothetical protein